MLDFSEGGCYNIYNYIYVKIGVAVAPIYAADFMKGEIMTKRLLSLLLVLVMLCMSISMMVSCGGTEVPDPTPDPNQGGNNTGNGNGNGGGGGGGQLVDKWDDVEFYDRHGDPLELTIQLSEYSDGEMTTGALKYMQGPGEEVADPVQNLVYQRNLDAEDRLGIHMNYVYLNKGWSYIKSEIMIIEKNGVDTPDLYCDMIYDMMGASIENGVFKNLYRYNLEDTVGYGDDYYEGGYFDFQEKYGFYVDYMDDLSLTEDKQFLMAGDYFLDVIRALLLLPFNIDLYTALVNPSDSKAYGLYETVRNYEWTWDYLKSMCNIYSGGEESLDQTLVMAIAHGGLSAVALVYSTQLDVYSATTDSDGKITGYVMNPKCPDLGTLFLKIKDLIDTNGIYADSSVLPEANREGINKCNNAFKNGTVLFATPTMMGALEEDVFQDMTSNMGVLPLPKLYEGSATSYCSIINGVGKVGALGYHSENGQAMSAYIQYITEHSLDVLTAYYDDAMKNRYTNDSGSKDMLDLIYDSIGSQKTMIIEELLMNRDWGTMQPYTWHQLIRDENFTGHASDISIQYDSCYDRKNNMLREVFDAWVNKADPVT